MKINELQNKNHELEESECSMRSEVERVQRSNKDKDDQITGLKFEKDALEKELEMYISKCKVCNMQIWTLTHVSVGCFEDLCRFSDLSAIL